MANVKSRTNAPKSASTKEKVPDTHKQTTPNVTDTIESNRVMRRPSTLKIMTTDEKVQCLLKNGHLIKEQIITKVASNGKKTNNYPRPTTPHVNKGGIIKKKTKSNLQLIDNILKSELLIDDTNKGERRQSTRIIENNNTLEVNDQNKTKNTSVLNTRRSSKDNKLKELNFKTRKPAQKPADAKPPGNFQCDHCQKHFNKKSSLRRHIYMHLDLKPHRCPKCPRRFRQRFNLRIHLKRQHPGFDLLAYENMIRMNNRFPCTICPKTYDSKTRLVLHIKSHLKIKEYICQHCGKEFLRVNSMKRHVQVCHSGHRIQCPVCKKDLKGHLTEHMRTHDKKRPHACEFCDARFTQSTQLNVHRRSHTGIRPYPCKICGRPFSHSNALMLHIRRHTGEKPFSCAMCPISFSQLPHMKAHMRNIHGKDDPYRCEKCQNFFKKKIELERHSKSCTADVSTLTIEARTQKSVSLDDSEMESVMTLSRMRFLLALLLTMIASKDKLKFLGFNKRLIDEILTESLDAMGQFPCKDESLTPLKRLKTNIEILLNWTVPKKQMAKFKRDNKSIEELLEFITDSKKKEE